MPSLAPEQVKSSLTADQFKLYSLIWKRFIASQMCDAIYDTVTADIASGEYTFRASGFSVQREGFTVLYEEGKDEAEESQSALPPLEEGMPLTALEIQPNQHFTQPPPRYSEATLIKALEENGIGRPSTYAPTITTVIQRGYVEREAKVLRPTVLGEVTTHLMEEQFQNIVDVAFTAKMENQLDGVEEGNTDWVETLRGFYEDFSATLQTAEENLSGVRVKIPDEETDIKCELCGAPMVIKLGRFGKFLACTGYPECKNTKNLVQETEGVCPLCGGKIVGRKSRTGKSFFGCENYPTCTFATWDTPIAEKCPKCSSTLFRTNGRWKKTHCLKPDCGFGQTPETPAGEKAPAKGKATKASTGAKTTTKRGSTKPEGVAGEKCEKCGGTMVQKKGRFGDFLACDGYPKCKNTKKLKAEENPA